MNQVQSSMSFFWKLQSFVSLNLQYSVSLNQLIYLIDLIFILISSTFYQASISSKGCRHSALGSSAKVLKQVLFLTKLFLNSRLGQSPPQPRRLFQDHYLQITLPNIFVGLMQSLSNRDLAWEPNYYLFNLPFSAQVYSSCLYCQACCFILQYLTLKLFLILHQLSLGSFFGHLTYLEACARVSILTRECMQKF